MRISCTGHSGFLVETTGCNYIFDFYTDKLGIIKPDLFSTKTIVFVSHRHGDHYNRNIFKWSGDELAYVLETKCRVPRGYESGKAITRMREGDTADILGVRVEAFGSTDDGVSYLVSSGGITVFHAGDLNDWYWEDESTPEELVRDEAAYLTIIRQLAGRAIDVAFIPEDPRLGRNAHRGIQHFQAIVAPKRIIPMHFPVTRG